MKGSHSLSMWYTGKVQVVGEHSQDARTKSNRLMPRDPCSISTCQPVILPLPDRRVSLHRAGRALSYGPDWLCTAPFLWKHTKQLIFFRKELLDAQPKPEGRKWCTSTVTCTFSLVKCVLWACYKEQKGKGNKAKESWCWLLQLKKAHDRFVLAFFLLVGERRLEQWGRAQGHAAGCRQGQDSGTQQTVVSVTRGSRHIWRHKIPGKLFFFFFF